MIWKVDDGDLIYLFNAPSRGQARRQYADEYGMTFTETYQYVKVHRLAAMDGFDVDSIYHGLVVGAYQYAEEACPECGSSIYCTVSDKQMHLSSWHDDDEGVVLGADGNLWCSRSCLEASNKRHNIRSFRMFHHEKHNIEELFRRLVRDRRFLAITLKAIAERKDDPARQEAWRVLADKMEAIAREDEKMRDALLKP